MLLSQKLNSNLAIARQEPEISLQQFEKGDDIAVFDSGIWQVYRGVVQLSRVQANGSETILGWVTANGTFGNCLDSASDLYRAVALSDVYARRYLSQDVIKDPLLARQFIAQFSDRLIKSEQLLSIIAIKKVEERFTQMLWMLQQEIGQSIENGIRLQVRFTHQQLAEAICTTRVTITRMMGDFQNKNLIYLDGDRHIVCTNSL
jgi:CRP-like cAMP-binding protein